MFHRTILIVLDSLGVGAAQDAARFGDEGAHTLGSISHWCEKNGQKFSLPHMSEMGLGQIYLGYGISTPSKATGATAILEELSPGKDTSTGHWELAGTPLIKEFPTYPDGFPQKLLDTWVKENNLPGYLGNYAASGTTILDELGEEHIASGKPIVYTSADSVFQIAASEEAFGLKRLYEVSESARKLLDPLGVGRVIARPFGGKSRGSFKRTENRRDYSVPPPYPNLLDVLRENDQFVAGVGKIEDIYAHRSVNIVKHTGRNETSMEATLESLQALKQEKGLIFTNLIDFDQLHGHRRNPKTYAEALMDFDNFLPTLAQAMDTNELLLLTADHGNDPTFKGSDHTRENVPLMIFSKHPAFKPQYLGQYRGFNTVARLILEAQALSSAVARIADLNTTDSILEKIIGQI